MRGMWFVGRHEREQQELFGTPKSWYSDRCTGPVGDTRAAARRRSPAERGSSEFGRRREWRAGMTRSISGIPKGDSRLMGSFGSSRCGEESPKRSEMHRGENQVIGARGLGPDEGGGRAEEEGWWQGGRRRCRVERGGRISLPIPTWVLRSMAEGTLRSAQVYRRRGERGKMEKAVTVASAPVR